MTFKLSETPKFSAKKFDYCRWFRFSYCAWNVNIWYRLSCRSCLYLTLLRLRNLFCACRATVQKRWRLYMYIPTMLWELITRQFRDIRKPFFCTNNIAHHRLGYFRTFLWFYEPALIFSVELSPLNPEEYGGFHCHEVMPSNASTLQYSFTDMLSPDQPVQISSTLLGNRNMINNMIEAWIICNSFRRLK